MVSVFKQHETWSNMWVETPLLISPGNCPKCQARGYMGKLYISSPIQCKQKTQILFFVPVTSDLIQKMEHSEGHSCHLLLLSRILSDYNGYSIPALNSRK